ncbi:MAG TPA: hypothetical protein VND68_00125 [Chloroflexia bacterium]|jgi:hypothetical protein|nr:hypothetical protein [Chloroflexia bacterium]
MQAPSLFDIEPVPGSVFIDNLMVSSADRLLSTQYANLAEEPELRDPIVASALFSHDLINLAILLESIVCHNTVYVNAEFIDIWNKNIWQDSLQSLQGIVRPVVWPHEQRVDAERQLSHALSSILSEASAILGDNNSSFLGFFTDVIYRTSHKAYSYGHRLIEDKFFQQPLAHPWSSQHAVILGAAFYLMCSQVIGVPYKPSILRAHILRKTIQREFRDRHFDAASIALDILEQGRTSVTEQYFEKLLELNLVEATMPCMLAAILKESKLPSDVLLLALQIRGSKEAIAFRDWSTEFSQTIQDGELMRIGVLYKEVEGIVRDVNRMLGITTDDNLAVTLGWGPVSLGRAFSLPKALQKPIRVKRHLWLLHNLYKELATMARFSDHVERVLLSNLPDWFRPDIPGESVWGSLRTYLRYD